MVDETLVAEQLARVTAELGDRAAELTTELVGVYDRELPQLVHDDERMVSLLSASVHQNIDTAMRIFQHAIDPEGVDAPAAAVEYARRLAQRGTPVIDLIRAYYLGQTTILEHSLAQAARGIEDAALLDAMFRKALTVTFAFIDRVTQQVVSAYQDERDRWLLNHSAVRAARVRSLLAGEAGDIDAVEAAIGYRLRGLHLGMVVWLSGEEHAAGGLDRLEALALSLQQRTGCPRRPLFVPHDDAGAWVWLPLDDPAVPKRRQLEETLAERGGGIRMALGEPGRDVEGFRRTHRQALRVQALAVAAGEHCDPILGHEEVGAMTLLAADLPAAGAWVRDVLGPLARDDTPHRRLRDTVRVFLATGGSYTTAAGRLNMHKNSVQYRVRKVEELLGRSVAEQRLDLELALNLCHRLGPAVLT
ncbi:PucR family transcriptional regulator [Amycolatopsis cihanbeyliensis]|uniref:PucR-like helix-turn-helix protein n=1 Tax=Amycolatopsis cihanbeyliensis TaxID=1128664 RepID=A0A542DEN8_AMYCI|nr:helix-turn-helix domain-containing protein [Amycolatopsis cihanbeyliensis]TQJ01548.1 PucR-like helix-turn-helix protein [Amycolatopsis cihanbeyliensis]